MSFQMVLLLSKSCPSFKVRSHCCSVAFPNDLKPGAALSSGLLPHLASPSLGPHIFLCEHPDSPTKPHIPCYVLRLNKY